MKFLHQLVESLDRFSSRFESFMKFELEMLSAPAESVSCKYNGVCSRKDGQKSVVHAKHTENTTVVPVNVL